MKRFSTLGVYGFDCSFYSVGLGGFTTVFLFKQVEPTVLNPRPWPDLWPLVSTDATAQIIQWESRFHNGFFLFASRQMKRFSALGLSHGLGLGLDLGVYECDKVLFFQVGR